MKFYNKLMRVVDVLEERFFNATEQRINDMVEEALANLDNEDARKSGKLIDIERWLTDTTNKLEPILLQAAIEGGQSANQLIGDDSIYIPKTVTKASEGMVEFIRQNILKFGLSMTEANVDIMTQILADGIADGLGIPEIRRQIQKKFFGEGKQAKIQAERVTRTEVIKASNAGTQDAYEQSGVVWGKQWLAVLDARTDADCAEMDGEIIEVSADYNDAIVGKFGSEKANKLLSYPGKVDYPPLHPSCRCTIIPILVDEKSAKLQVRMGELENKIDKRTKAYRDLQKEHYSLTDYVNELEKIVEVLND
jgi:SPP1 gp7 family putative phage head morphogenesis protein